MYCEVVLGKACVDVLQRSIRTRQNGDDFQAIYRFAIVCVCSQRLSINLKEQAMGETARDRTRATALTSCRKSEQHEVLRFGSSLF